MNSGALDRHITGNWGEDQYREGPPPCPHTSRVFLGTEPDEETGTSQDHWQCRGCGDLFDQPSPLVILGCGKAKQSMPAPAGQLYTGGYFKARRRYALTLTEPDHVLILSAKHGLLALHDYIQPYDTTWGDPEAVDDITLAAQKQLSVWAGWAGPVVVLAGQAYVAKVRQLWPDAEAPLQGGIGQQLAWMKEQTEQWKE